MTVNFLQKTIKKHLIIMSSGNDISIDLYEKDPENKMDNNYRQIRENQIDPKSDKFPTCIVWTPLPCIT